MDPAWPVRPMELVARNEPYDDAQTVFQVKWDGVRCLAYAQEDGVRLFNRRLNPRSMQYLDLLTALRTLPAGTVLDGEIIAPGPDGKPLLPRVLRRDLVRAANPMLTAAVPVHYMVFDVLWLRGQPIHKLELTKRIDALASLSLSEPVLRVDSVNGWGKLLFAAVSAEGLEGIVAKKASSRYLIGQRSNQWEKIKCMRERDGLIGGYIPKPDGMRCVLVGIEENGSLMYIGKVGTGPTHRQWAALQARLVQMHGPCPFLKPPAEPQAVWVHPKLQVRVRFMEYTKEGVMRAPVLTRLPEGNI